MNDVSVIHFRYSCFNKPLMFVIEVSSFEQFESEKVVRDMCTISLLHLISFAEVCLRLK